MSDRADQNINEDAPNNQTAEKPPRDIDEMDVIKLTNQSLKLTDRLPNPFSVTTEDRLSPRNITHLTEIPPIPPSPLSQTEQPPPSTSHRSTSFDKQRK